jgi:hypothetical protein
MQYLTTSSAIVLVLGMIVFGLIIVHTMRQARQESKQFNTK